MFYFCPFLHILGTSWTILKLCLNMYVTFVANVKKHFKNAIEMSPKLGQDGSRWLQVGSKLAHVGPSWGDFEAMLAYVGASWGHLKIAWNHLKIAWKVGSKILILYCFLQCFWAPTLAKMAQVGSKLANVGPSWRHFGAMQAYVGASWDSKSL